jgi:hypothetical protein
MMARIRTIKPEFWQNEQLASLNQHARLLAIALLNHADDDGYFLANIALVRAACFPFDDDSTNVRRSLDELSHIGYIEVREATGKAIGRVVKFKDHQRIDRPQKSKLHDQFAEINEEKRDSRKFDERSTNDRRMIDEPSLLERNGKEQGMEKERSSFEADKQPSKQVDPSSCRFPIFPACGDPFTWEASHQQLSEWAATYTAVDVVAAHRRAHAWVMANLSKRKTAKGYPKFMNAWLAKMQDKAGSLAAPAATTRTRSFTT